jgi:hypothetical protein
MKKENEETPDNKLFSIIIDASEYNYSGYPISSDWDFSNKVKMIFAGNDEHLKELLYQFEDSLSKVEDHSGSDSEEYGADYQVKVMEIKDKAHEKFLSELKEPLVLYKYEISNDSDDRDCCWEDTDIADIEGITKKEIKILSILDDDDDGVTLIINESKSSASNEEDEDEDEEDED